MQPSARMSTSVARITTPGTLSLLRRVNEALREVKKVDPRDRYCFIHPDSDQAHVGMGFKLLNITQSEEVYQKSSDIVKKDILKLCLNGPKSELYDSIENRNVATYVTTQATIAKLLSEKPDIQPFCKISLGIGVGFVNALVFHGLMRFEDGLELVQYQGRAMDRAANMIPSAKLRIRLRPATSKSKVCRAAQEHCLRMDIPPHAAICSVTKQMKAHWIEVGGHEEAIKYLETEGQRLFEFFHIQRITKSPQPINTQLMRPVQEFVRGYLDHKIKDNSNYLQSGDSCTVYSSTSGYRCRKAETIKKDLINYPTHPVKMEQVFHSAFKRRKDLAQPNIFVLWDKKIIRDLNVVNRRAAEKAKLVEA